MHNSCPNCGTYHKENEIENGWTATFGFQLEGADTLKDSKVFTAVLKSTYTNLLPGSTLTEPHEVEEEIFNVLPKPVIATITYGNVVKSLECV